MAVSEKHIDEIVLLYDNGNGDSILDLARTYNLTKAGVTYHLKQRGVYVAPIRAEKTVSNEPAAQSDEDLGISEEPTPTVGGFDVQALMADSGFAKLIDTLVEKRMQNVSVASPVAAAGSEAAFNAFLSKFDHMLEVQAEQRPGYIKPLSSDEMDSRKKGRGDMFALLRKLKAENDWPHYLLTGDGPGAVFYGPSANGPVLYEAGQEIKTFLPPSELFVPLNESAARVVEAYKRWIGEVVPIEDLIAQAAAAARGDTGAPEVFTEMATLDPAVQVVDAPLRDTAPKRVLGTITPELRGKTMPRQTGVTPQPAGPMFVTDAA